MNQSKKSNVIIPPSGTFTVDITYLYKVKFFDIYKLFVKLTVTVNYLYINNKIIYTYIRKVYDIYKEIIFHIYIIP